MLTIDEKSESLVTFHLMGNYVHIKVYGNLFSFTKLIWICIFARIKWPNPCSDSLHELDVYLLINTASYSESNNSSSWLVAFPRLLTATVHHQADCVLPVIMMEALQHLFSVINYYILYVLL